jgi:hypothetical protein
MLTAQSASPSPSATQTGTASPTARLTSGYPTALPSSLATSTPGQIRFTGTPAVLCNQAAAGSPIDISIPDDSEFAPGESFNKTWRLVNIGTCTWTTLYSASFFYGDRMNSPEVVPLQRAVPPSQDVEISIDMLAPQSAGVYQGNWKLSSENGDLFGIGPNADSPFWVRIIVVEDETETPAPTVSATPTITPTVVITPTETPQGDISGKLSPIPGDSIDLDTVTLNGAGIDLDYQVDNDGKHGLVPQDAALIGIYGSELPMPLDCQTAGMSSTPLVVENLPVGTYLCYTTNEARLGRALLEAVNPVNFNLTLDLTTWVLP